MILVIAGLVGLVTAYIVEVLLFQEKVSHYGPFPSKERKVIHIQHRPDGTVSEYTQPVTWFEWFRRGFGVYTVLPDEGTTGDPENEIPAIPPSETWFVNPEAIEVWTCPTCLSFWVSVIVSLVAFIAFPEITFSQYIMLVGAGASLSTIIHRYI